MGVGISDQLPKNIRRHKTSGEFTQTFFAEHANQPSVEEIEQLVDYVSHGEFAKSSIQLQKCVGFEPADLSKNGVTVYRFRTARPEHAS